MSFLSALLTWILCFGSPVADCSTGVSIATCPGDPVATSTPIEEPDSGLLPWGVTSDISNGF
jgi:hypothetical protein